MQTIEPPTLPIRTAHRWGSFFSLMQFTKPPIPVSQQIQKLQSRGLVIKNIDFATVTLENISYYRLQGYWWFLQSDSVNHQFKTGVTFEDIVKIYAFDSQLRHIVFDAIETIEIAFRTKLIYHLSLKYGNWWFENANLFHSSNFFEKNLTEIDRELKRSNEVFITEHYRKYSEPERPPAYKTLEILSLGILSKLFKLLNRNIKQKKAIAKSLGLRTYHLENWILSITVIRNICAHHSRLWNRRLPKPIKELTKTNHNFIKGVQCSNIKLFYALSIILYLNDRIKSTHQFKTKLKGLISEHPFINLVSMGFPENWNNTDIWK